MKSRNLVQKFYETEGVGASPDRSDTRIPGWMVGTSGSELLQHTFMHEHKAAESTRALSFTQGDQCSITGQTGFLESHFGSTDIPDYELFEHGVYPLASGGGCEDS